MHILCISLSATIQRTLSFDSFSLNAVNRTQCWREDASGKALNAARVLNQIEPGCSLVVCPVGNDNANQFMKIASQDSDLYIEPLYIAGSTRECWTVLDGKHATTTEIVSDEPTDAHHLAGAEAELELLETVRDYIAVFDAILFAGSRPAHWSVNLCARICKLAADAGKTILADFRGEELLRTLKVCTPHIIKINEEEFCQTFSNGLLLSTEELTNAIIAKSTELKNTIVVTRGEKETIAAQNGTVFRCPAEKITNLVNTTACGDAFAAGFLHEYLHSGSMESALQAGTHCATLNAQSLVPGSINS